MLLQLVAWPAYPRLKTMQGSEGGRNAGRTRYPIAALRGVGAGSRRVFRFRTASCDFIRHAEEAGSPPASF